LGAGSGVTLSARLVVFSLPLRGYQTWRFGYLKPNNTRDMVIPPIGSHFNCATTLFSGHDVKVCARLDAGQTCKAGPNFGGACSCPAPLFECQTSAECGVGFWCESTVSSGEVDCAGGNIPVGYDSVVQLDHNTNQPTVGGQPNIGLPSDPSCTNTFLTPDGTVLTSCVEGVGADCSGPANVHLGVCNSPAEQLLSGTYPAGGFTLQETIDLSFAIGADCTATFCYCGQGTCSGGASPANTPCYSAADCVPSDTCTANNGATCTANADCVFPGMIQQGTCGVCPPDTCPLQDGELRITGQATSGTTKGVLWQVNDTALIMGTTGAGNGAEICGSAAGGPDCVTTASGQPFPNCVAALPTQLQLTGAAVVLAYPAIDNDQTVGDSVMTLRLQCGDPTNTPSPTQTPTNTPTPTSTPATACAVAPRTGCQQPQRSSGVSLNTASHRARWRWLGGSTPVTLSQFGDPVNGPTAYHVCLYDTNAGVPSLAFSATVPTGGTCGSRQCWKLARNRFTYTNPAASPDGVRQMTLKPSASTGAAIVVSGRGPNLHTPVSADGIYLLREFPRVIVQLQRSDSPSCWEAVFPGPPVRDTRLGFADAIR